MKNLFLLGFILGLLLQIPLAYPQQKQIIYGQDGQRLGSIEQQAPWSNKQIIRDVNGNRIGTIELQAPWSSKNVIRNNDGVTQQTISPQDPFGDNQDPFAPQSDDNNN